jgi:hypothetical protein
LVLAAVAFKFTNFREFAPSRWGKASTFLQIMTAIGVMGAVGYQDTVLLRICNGLIAGIVILAVITGAEYSWRGVAWFRNRDQSARQTGAGTLT